jgi:uncharacterized BrkB/YihY/UPF0761 family membrane protein
MNQLVSVGLIFTLRRAWRCCPPRSPAPAPPSGVPMFGLDRAPPGVFFTGLFKLASIPITIFVLFLSTGSCRTQRSPPALILPHAIVIGLALEALKWMNLLMWPWIYSKLSREYGVFVNSVTILTWSSLAAMAVLGGADWSARRARLAQAEENRDRMGAETLPPTQV